VPAATLLVPYFRVSRHGAQVNADIPDVTGQTDYAARRHQRLGHRFIRTSWVFNKYSLGVLDFNVPLTAYDVVTSV